MGGISLPGFQGCATLTLLRRTCVRFPGCVVGPGGLAFLSEVGAAAFARVDLVPGAGLSGGVVVDGGELAWGVCPLGVDGAVGVVDRHGGGAADCSTSTLPGGAILQTH